MNPVERVDAPEANASAPASGARAVLPVDRLAEAAAVDLAAPGDDTVAVGPASLAQSPVDTISSTTTAVPPELAAAEPNAGGPGAQLARAREACGWSVAEVARQLKLSPRQIEALEAEAFDRLRSPIYVRGFARSYARLVGADQAALMRALDERCPLPTAAPPVPIAMRAEAGLGAVLPSADRPSRRYVRIAVAVLLAVAAVAVVDRVWSPLASWQFAAPAPVVVQPLEPAGGATAPPNSAASDPAAPAPAEVPRAAEPGAAVAPVPAGAGPSGGSATRTVRVAFDRESWVEIRDASGKIILSGLNRAGTEQVVRGTAPFAIVVGNASGVRIDYEARRVDLQPHTQVNVARLTLD
jgi:cytoskeleton protein RodZ